MDLKALLEVGRKRYAPFCTVAQKLCWRISRKGNEFAVVDGFHIVVFRRSDNWMYRIECQSTGRAWFAQDPTSSDLEAKAMALEFLEHMQPKPIELSRLLKEVRAESELRKVLSTPVDELGNSDFSGAVRDFRRQANVVYVPTAVWGEK